MQHKISLDDKYSLTIPRAYLTGVEALVRLLFMQRYRDAQAGLNTAGFVSGYRGSPLGTLDQSMEKAAAWLDEYHIHFQPGVNEDLAATAVWGTQQTHLFPGAKYDGVFSMWYGKGPGVDRSMDAIKHANAFGSTQHGGVLAVVGDDHACKSSTLPQQSEPMLMGAAVPILNPANVQEVLEYGIYGWALSRFSGCWVGMKAITESMDSAISAELDPHRVQIHLPQDFNKPPGGLNAQWPTTPLEQEELLYTYRIPAVRAFARLNQLNQITLDTPEAKLGIVTTGKSHTDVLEALECLGIDQTTAAQIGIRLYKVGMSWPLEPDTTAQFAQGLKEIIVVEEKRSIIEDQLIAQLYRLPATKRPLVIGKLDEHGNALVTELDELTPAMVARILGARIIQFHENAKLTERLQFLDNQEKQGSCNTPTLTRTPYFCSGCPHNTSTRIPEGSIGMAGIGCHYMVKWMDRNTETFTQMGGEGASWIGIAPFTDTPHVFQNIGDGTYFHSGVLAIRAAVASSVNITYKVLFNDAVAMTGGQAVDGSLNLSGLVAQLQAEGVAKLAVVAEDINHAKTELRGNPHVTIRPRSELDQLQREFRQISGTTVIVYDQVCAAEKRRRRKRGSMPLSPTRVFINADVCEGCGDCSATSNCLSVLPKQTELGTKRQIDQSSCNQDLTCLDGFCPSFVSVRGAKLQSAPANVSANREMEVDLPEPTIPSLDRPWNILITGIGGTGVLTLGSLLALAAHIEGKGGSTLNQTGLAQKFGAVISHVRIANAQSEIHAVRIPEGAADVLLGCDLVVASMPQSLLRLATDRSHSVINTYESPTADFIHDQNYRFPGEAMQKTIREHTDGDSSDQSATKNNADRNATHFINATQIARQLLGDSIASNLFLLGFAYQLGLIPLRADSIYQAIDLNNVAIEFNQQAFDWGRHAVVDSKSIENLLDETIENETDSATALTDEKEIIAWRYRYLTAYQSKRYANRYQHFMKRIQHCGNELLTEAVARNYFKLLAYKDEYEIARLYSNGKFIANIKKQFAGSFQLNFHLAIPLLSRKHPLTGHLLKRKYPGSILTLFKLLAKLKFLRGTPLDLFGYTFERRQERKLITDYEKDLTKIIKTINADNSTGIVEIAALPEIIKGFGHIKTNNIQEYYQRKKQLLEKLPSLAR